MGIKYITDRRIFHLFTDEFSYYIHINKYNYLIHLYAGSRMDDISKERTSERYMERYEFLNEYNKMVCDEDYYFSSVASQKEAACFGKGDKRGAFAIVEGENGIDLTNFLYEDYEIIDGIIDNYTLPIPRFNKKDTKTLILKLKDENRNIYLNLYYVINEKYNCLVRFSSLINKENHEIKVKKLSSLELDLPSSNYDILALKGSWNNDKEIERIPLNHSLTEIGDNHGTRGFFYNQSLALMKNDANNDYGEVFGFSYMYSGDFAYEFKVDEIDQTRVLVGFNKDSFEYVLNKDENLFSPSTILVYSSLGLNKMSQTFHDIIRETIIPSEFAFQERPILLNSWEACFFDFNTDKLISFIDEAHKLNIELVVLDDGWFGNRNLDNSSLGDWFVNKDKIDLKKVVEHAHKLKMKFGIWVEPEMISPESELYKNHPEYSLFPKGYKKPTLLRHQMVLDLVNKEARDNVYSQISQIFKEYKIDYVKWDFNRYLTEAYSNYLEKPHKKETIHKFILGLYDLLDRFNKDFPEVLLETCASGGGRFDLGMLYYCPQIWGSDETDISLRANIQYSLNTFYPLSCIGAHISSRKIGSIQDKACLAFFGTYGYEMDITKLNQEDKNKIIEFNDLFKKWHHIVTKGDYYSIFNPFNSNYVSWNIVTKDKKECAVYFMNHRKEITKARFIKIKGLEKDKYYFNSLTNDIYKGSFYMNVGLNISAPLDPYTSMLFILKEIPSLIAKPMKAKQLDGGKRDSLF